MHWLNYVVALQDKDPRMLQLIIQRLGANVGDLHLNMTASYTPTNGGSAGMDADATVNVVKFQTLFYFCSQTKLWLSPSADPEGGTGGPDPPGKSQVIWVCLGNKQLDPPPPPPWKMLDPPPPWKMLDPLWNLEK